MADTPPNVLVLMSDQHNYRCLGYRDDDVGEPVSTPTFDRLAADGVDFDQAYCPMPKCTPSRMCFLSGRRVPGAGAWNNGSWLRPELETMPESFSAAGYETCLVGKMHLGGDRQFAGFDHRPYGDLLGGNGHQYDPVSPEDRVPPTTDPINNENAGITDYPESQHQEQIVEEETLAFLREHRHRSDDPWFLCASFSRPHDPYTTPPRHFERHEGEVPDPKIGPEGDTLEHPSARRYREGYAEEDPAVTEQARAAYFANVDYLDEITGDLLALLERDGFLENTIVVYLSDHGDMIGEHGMWRKNIWFEGSVRVPMLLSLPEHRDGAGGPTVETPTSLVDLYPTLCGLCGVDAPEGLDGADLSTAIRAGREPDRGPVVTDQFSGMDYRMVRDGDYKYIRFRDDDPEVLIDLAEDPLERHNLAPDATGTDAGALERLRSFVDDTLDFEAIVEQRERDQELAHDHRIGAPTGIAGNAYRLRTGQIVDAGIAVTKPDVLLEHPERVLIDDPAREDGEGI